MNLFEKVFDALNRASVKYLVVGGAAVNLHGYLRFTADLDLLLLLTKQNLEKMDRVMKKLGYTERLPVSVMDLSNRKQVEKWIKEKNLRAYSFVPPKDNPLQIDVVIEESLRFNDYYRKKVLKTEGDIHIPLIALRNLLEMKRKAKREKDMLDLKVLRCIHDL